ncbi:MAG: hypothetical protein ABSB00_01375 [Minisyncoccia bacterium]|jgi:hypothetical protein
MNLACVVTLITFLLFVFGIPVLMFFTSSHFGTKSNSDRGGIAILGMLLALFGTMAYSFEGGWKNQKETDELRHFYREWEVISHHGAVGFSFYLLGKYIRYTVGIIGFLVMIILWFLLSIPTGVVVAFLFFVAELAQGLYRIVSRPGHWLCFGATVTVTAFSWFFFHKHFTDPRVLWTVALGTGVISGGVTEMARSLLLFCANVSAISQMFTKGKKKWQTIIANYNDGADYYATAIIGLWFGQSRAARVLRAICFNTPIAWPVRII